MQKRTIIRLGILGLILVIGFFLLSGNFASFYLYGISALMCMLTLLWLLSLWIKDASIIDIFWGTGFVFVAWAYAKWFGFENMGTRQYVLLSMITLWGLRLSLYLASRNLGKGEDYRYVQWRKENGARWWWFSFIQVFALQGFLLWIISAVFVPSLSTGDSLVIWDYLGIVLWAIGFYFEAVGDWQLRQFKADLSNQGKVMDQGLWRYTRHPNYFGDALLWWGYFCFGLAHPQGFLYIFCPIIMTFFLLNVSGVAMLEKTLKKTKPKYAEYIRKTSAFIPKPPKK